MDGSDCSSDDSSSVRSVDSDIEEELAQKGAEWYKAEKSRMNNQIVDTEHVFTRLEVIEEEEEENG